MLPWHRRNRRRAVSIAVTWATWGQSARRARPRRWRQSAVALSRPIAAVVTVMGTQCRVIQGMVVTSMAKEGMVTARTGITAEEGVEVVVAVPVVVVPVVVMSMAGGIAGRPDRCNV